jgi:hypothetical protein
LTNKPLSPTGRSISQAPGSGAQRTPEIMEFLDKLKTRTPIGPGVGRGRLIVAIDATASRGPTWDSACRIQGEMFEATAGLGGLAIQLVFYRGYNECRSSRWVTTAGELHRLMTGVQCVGGFTQIGRVLTHTVAETRRQKVNALVFVGDAFEERIDEVCAPAGELGKLGTPVFLFQEVRDPDATSAFKQIAGLSGGAHLAFDLANIDRLKELLGAVAAYAAGGRDALLAYGNGKSGEILRLTSQLRS